MKPVGAGSVRPDTADAARGGGAVHRRAHAASGPLVQPLVGEGAQVR